VNAGSRYEQYNEKGAAHLLSIAAFSGTQQRSGLRLMRDIENQGFEVSATSDREKVFD
jgi:predicted Zn-dependent peptidase